MQKDLINEGKLYITSEDLNSIKLYYSKLINTSFDIDLNYQFIYKELFLHSCYVGNKDINIERTEQAIEVEPDIIAAGCPFCNTMMTDGVKSVNEGAAEVLDIAELIADNI